MRGFQLMELAPLTPTLSPEGRGSLTEFVARSLNHINERALELIVIAVPLPIGAVS